MARTLDHRLQLETDALVASSAKAIFDSRGDTTICPLEAVATIRSGVTLGRTLAGDTIAAPYLRVANVQDGWLDLRGVKQIAVLPSELFRWSLRRGDLLLTEGGDWDKLGRCAMWDDEIPGCIHQNHIFCVRVTSDVLLPRYLAELVGSPVGKAYFQASAKQTTNLASIAGAL